MKNLLHGILAIMLLALMPSCRCLGESLGRLNIAILGDSNTSIGGDDCSLPQGWTKWFKEKLSPTSCRSFARSGATWTNTVNTTKNVIENTDKLSDNNVVYNQALRLIQACDSNVQSVPNLIIIAAGTNDAWFCSRRPGLFSKTVNQAFSSTDCFMTDRKVSTVCTLAESVRYVCEMLMQRFPDAQIILLTPMQTVKAPYERVQKVGDIIEQCAHRMSLPVIRQDYCNGVYDVRERIAKHNTSDGTHTSVAGAKRNGCYLANQVASMLSYK